MSVPLRPSGSEPHRFSHLQKFSSEAFHHQDDYEDDVWDDMELVTRSGSPAGTASPSSGPPVPAVPMQAVQAMQSTRHSSFAGSQSGHSVRLAQTARPHHGSMGGKSATREKETKERKNPAQKVRAVVSKNKVRFQEDGFDLDLTYITKRLIAMGFPSSGTEGYYRNQIDDVERFFSTRHSGHYHVYNLCSERTYDTQARFGGHHTRFPFDDHNPPVPISIIPQFIRHANTWLAADPENIIAVHCKAGKGRTGVFIGCLLLAQAFEKSSQGLTSTDALKLFGSKRTKDGNGVTIPSQRRYITYWEYILRNLRGQLPVSRRVRVDFLKINSTVKEKGINELYFTIALGERDGARREIYSSQRDFSSKSAFRESRGMFVFDMSGLNVVVTGDVLFRVRRKSNVFSDDNLFHFWLNVDLEADRSEHFPDRGLVYIRLDKPQIDKAVKDKSHENYKRDLYVEVQFSDADGRASSPFSPPSTSTSYFRATTAGGGVPSSPVSSPLRVPSASPFRRPANTFSPLSIPSSNPTEPSSPYLMDRSPTASPSQPPSRQQSTYKMAGAGSLNLSVAGTRDSPGAAHTVSSALNLSSKLVLPPNEARSAASSPGPGGSLFPAGHLRLSRMVFRPSRAVSGAKQGLIAKLRCGEEIRFTDISEVTSGCARWSCVLDWQPMVLSGPAGQPCVPPDLEFTLQQSTGDALGAVALTLQELLPPVALWSSGARTVESIASLWKEGVAVGSTFSSPGVLHLAASYDLLGAGRPSTPAGLQQQKLLQSAQAAGQGGQQQQHQQPGQGRGVPGGGGGSAVGQPSAWRPVSHPKFSYYLALCGFAASLSVVVATHIVQRERRLQRRSLRLVPMSYEDVAVPGLTLVESPSPGSTPSASQSERGGVSPVRARLSAVVGGLRSAGLAAPDGVPAAAGGGGATGGGAAASDSSASPPQLSPRPVGAPLGLPHHPQLSLTSTFQCASRLSNFMLTYDAKLVRFEEKERIDLTLLDNPPSPHGDFAIRLPGYELKVPSRAGRDSWVEILQQAALGREVFGPLLGSCGVVEAPAAGSAGAAQGDEARKLVEAREEVERGCIKESAFEEHDRLQYEHMSAALEKARQESASLATQARNLATATRRLELERRRLKNSHDNLLRQDLENSSAPYMHSYGVGSSLSNTNPNAAADSKGSRSPNGSASTQSPMHRCESVNFDGSPTPDAQKSPSGAGSDTASEPGTPTTIASQISRAHRRNLMARKRGTLLDRACQTELLYEVAWRLDLGSSAANVLLCLCGALLCLAKGRSRPGLVRAESVTITNWAKQREGEMLSWSSVAASRSREAQSLSEREMQRRLTKVAVSACSMLSRGTAHAFLRRYLAKWHRFVLYKGRLPFVRGTRSTAAPPHQQQAPSTAPADTTHAAASVGDASTAEQSPESVPHPNLLTPHDRRNNDPQPQPGPATRGGSGGGAGESEGGGGGGGGDSTQYCTCLGPRSAAPSVLCGDGPVPGSPWAGTGSPQHGGGEAGRLPSPPRFHRKANAAGLRRCPACWRLPGPTL